LAEVTFELVDAHAAKVKLDTLGVVVDDLELTDKDMKRRSGDYHRGYFLPLRRQALQGFNEQKLAVLMAAEASLERVVPQHLRKQRRRQIAVDRAWVQEMEAMHG
jgi:malonyl CoA-acyl carrier protein transacylase